MRSKAAAYISPRRASIETAETWGELLPDVVRAQSVQRIGGDAELDELRNLTEHGDQFLLDMETRERERTGISNLRIRYNKVHGYYIEVSRGQADKVPPEKIALLEAYGAKVVVCPTNVSADDPRSYYKTAERIRDKIAASKKKGLWMGATVPLGYAADGRSLKIAEQDAAAEDKP